MPVNPKLEAAHEAVDKAVAALPDLTPAERQRTLDIAHAHVDSHSGDEPHYGNIAHLTRGYRVQEHIVASLR